MKKIFLVEDDNSLISGLKFALEKQGYEVDYVRTKEEAIRCFNNSYNLVILDVSLPDGTGFDVCMEIRKKSKVPVIFLTASDEETDIIMGLDIGGDDYITKPFKLAVLFSRINALLRRSGEYVSENSEIISNGIRIVQSERRVYKGENIVELTASEYKLLKYFMENKDIVLSGEQIIALLWDCDERYIDNNTLSVYIRRLRIKIEDNPSKPERIVTLRGMGYKWNSGEKI